MAGELMPLPKEEWLTLIGRPTDLGCGLMVERSSSNCEQVIETVLVESGD